MRNRHDARIGHVLIHGAGLGAWIWRDVIPLLPAPAVAVDFPHREKPAESRRDLSLEDYVASIARQIRAWPAERFVITAHSIGGVLAPQVIETFDDRVAGFVAVAAVIPANGGSFLSALPVPQRLLIGAVMRLFGTRPSEVSIKKGLCSDLPPETAAEVVGRFAPESRALYTSNVSLEMRRVPSLYVQLTEDEEIPVRLQRRMIANLRADHTEEISSGHMPMLSRPAELARALNGFAARLDTA